MTRSVLAAWVLAALVLFAPASSFAQADPAFSALTGPVVDGANLLGPDQRQTLADKLKAQEDKTSDQVVVATVSSLGGLEIEDYANRLYRAWKLGEAKRNNGVLLLVAPTERKVRIEVGYGLEGALTDAVTGLIIRTAIAPRFKAGDYAGGLSAGTDAILAVLSGDAEEWQRRAAPKAESGIDPIVLFVIAIIVILIISRLMGGGGGGGRAYRNRGGSWIVPTSGGFGGGFGGGGFGGGLGGGGGFGGGGGGYSGGGGSSGGGGASGSW